MVVTGDRNAQSAVFELRTVAQIRGVRNVTKVLCVTSAHAVIGNKVGGLRRATVEGKRQNQ